MIGINKKRSLHSLLHALEGSELLAQFSIAFRTATGLPLILEHPDDAAHRQKSLQHNPVCHQLRTDPLVDCVCQAVHHRLRIASSQEGPLTRTCPFGLTIHMVPLHYRSLIFGYLVTSFPSDHETHSDSTAQLIKTLTDLGSPPEVRERSAQIITSAAEQFHSPSETVFHWLDAFAALVESRAPHFDRPRNQPHHSSA